MKSVIKISLMVFCGWQQFTHRGAQLNHRKLFSNRKAITRLSALWQDMTWVKDVFKDRRILAKCV